MIRILGIRNFAASQLLHDVCAEKPAEHRDESSQSKNNYSDAKVKTEQDEGTGDE